MAISAAELLIPHATAVRVDDETLSVDMDDGRTIAVPLAWYPRLAMGNRQERSNWRLIGQGRGIHWPDLDEDIGIEGLIVGRPSGESQESLARWVALKKGH